jgi:hypothetical protein
VPIYLPISMEIGGINVHVPVGSDGPVPGHATRRSAYHLAPARHQGPPVEEGGGQQQTWAAAPRSRGGEGRRELPLEGRSQRPAAAGAPGERQQQQQRGGRWRRAGPGAVANVFRGASTTIASPINKSVLLAPPREQDNKQTKIAISILSSLHPSPCRWRAD